MRRSRSAASIPRSSGAARGCRRSGSPTPTAPGSPTVRRRRRRRCWRAPRIIRAPRWRRVRPARTRRRRSCCRGRATRCPVRVSIKAQGPFGPNGPYPAIARCRFRRRRTPTACPRHRGSRSPGDRALRPGRSGHTGADRAGAARSAHRAAGTAAGPVPPIPLALSPAPLPPGPPAPPGPGNSCLLRSSAHRAERAAADAQGGSQN